MTEEEKLKRIDEIAYEEFKNEKDGCINDADDGDIDPMFEESAREVVSKQEGSTSFIQRKFKLGYNRAGRIMDQLEREKIVGPSIGSKTREVLIKTVEELECRLENSIGRQTKIDTFYNDNYVNIQLKKQEYTDKEKQDNEEREKQEIKQKLLEKERKKQIRK